MAQEVVSKLDCVPDEIISALLYFISPDDNLHGVQLVSRRLNRLANEPLLWRHHCCGAFKHWHPAHNFQDKIEWLACETDWKELFLLRAHQNRRIARLLDAIIETKVGRLRRFELICQLGYDAKDFLLEQCQTDPCADDGLARRHYSNAILSSIHRSIAIEEWHSLQRAPDKHRTPITGVQLERALGSFDMFVLHDQSGDLNDISRMLDEHAARFRASHPDFDISTTRQKALTLVRWLRANNLMGVCNPERDYRNLRNCLIGQALRHEDHESIPIISCAIFCCVASRLGMDARCCAFPSHVHAIVYAVPGQTLDNLPVTVPVLLSDSPSERMFLDPYGTDDEVPVSALHAILARLGWRTDQDVFLAPVSALSITMRTAQNLRATLARILELQDHAHPELSQLMRGDNARNVEACLYSASWASLMLTPPDELIWIERLSKFLRRIAGSWPEDVWLIEKYLRPIYSSIVRRVERIQAHDNQGPSDPWQYWRFIREQDGVVPRVVRRDLTEPPFKIGQVFRHRRYGWIGVITSWSDRRVRQSLMPGSGDTDGTGSRRAIFFHGQPLNHYYFTCLPSTGAEPHVVGIHNIKLVSDPNLVTDGMFPMAGKFFKRFDPATCSFVSNMKEQFPDD